MKTKDFILLIFLLGTAGALTVFSPQAKSGAYDGLLLAEGTIIPSLTPLLIIFLIVMKTGAKDALAKLFGSFCRRVFNLPSVCLPAILLGLIGGYPTGALLTKELFDNEEIDNNQAKRMMCFNFCGGCGFIITAVGVCTLGSKRAGFVLFFSNVIASLIIGFALSFTQKRIKAEFYSYTCASNPGDILSKAVGSAVNSVLNITAFIILFSAIRNIFKVPDILLPLIEITSGICAKGRYSLALTSAFLSFGGLCIHFQIFDILKQFKMKYFDFLLFRLLSAGLSYLVTQVLLVLFPVDLSVFSNGSTPVELSSVNIGLSVLMILGCFVSILDISSRRVTGKN